VSEQQLDPTIFAVVPSCHDDIVIHVQHPQLIQKTQNKQGIFENNKQLYTESPIALDQHLCIVNCKSTIVYVVEVGIADTVSRRLIIQQNRHCVLNPFTPKQAVCC